MDTILKRIFDAPAICPLAFTIAVLFVVFSYQSMLMPILDKSLSFATGDMSAVIGDNSSLVRSDFTFNMFDNGEHAQDWNRAMFLEWISVPAGWFGCTDSQVQSVLMLISIIIGSSGIYLLINILGGGRFGALTAAALNIVLIPFYFLNLWSVARLGHNWIWMTYAIFPFFIYCGLAYLRKNKTPMLVLYCLTLIFFGMIPHDLIYMLAIHGTLFMLALCMDLPWRTRLMFLVIPALLYLIASTPLLLIGLMTSVSYPYGVDTGMAWVLSNNGIMIRTLTAANDWWPQIPYAEIRDNMPFRESMIAIIASTIIISAFAFPKLGRSDKWLVAISLFGALAVVFMAQGMNNSILATFVNWMGSNGFDWVLGPFREWARVSIMMPIFLFIALITGISGLKRDAMVVAVLLVIIFMAINIVCSPSWRYLADVYSAVRVPDDYYELGRIISPIHKNMMVGTIDKQDILGSGRYSWNTSKVLSGVLLSGVANGYDKTGLDRLVGTGDMPQNILDTLDIKYVIKANATYGGSKFGVNYEWLDCNDFGHFRVCENKHNISKFNVYNIAILAEEDANGYFGLFFLNQTNAAVSSTGGPQDGYVLLNDPLAFEVQQAKDEHIVPTISGKWKTEDGWIDGNLLSNTLDGGSPEINPNAIYSDKKDAKAWDGLDIGKAGRFEVLVRALKSEDGGDIELKVGDLDTTLKTADNSEGFVWMDVGNATLKAGQQNVSVINIDGKNAIEEIVLISTDDIESLKNNSGISNLLPMYVLEADTNFRPDDPSSVETIDVGRFSSSGRLLHVINDTSLRAKVEVPNDAEYMIVVKGQGNYSLIIGNRTTDVSSRGLIFSYSGPFHLDKGSNEIVMKARDGVYVDAVVVYATKSGGSSESIFGSVDKPASVLYYKRISPTRWDVRLNATRPFLLSFAESYGSQWEAQVYKDGILKETAPSSMLFDTMNGFWINTTGDDIDVRIVFKPQTIFEATLLIPIFVILGCATYLCYSFTTRKKSAGGGT